MKRSKISQLAAVAIIILIGVFVASGCAKPEATPTPTPIPPSTPTPTPKVHIIIYSDFLCHACAELSSEVEGELLRLYVDTGKATMELRPLDAVAGNVSVSLRAAEAVLCAGDQGKVWEYSEAIYAVWLQSGEVAYSEEELQKTASDLGLNTEVFSACLDSGAKGAVVEENMNSAGALGLKALPAVLINGNLTVGIKPLQTYVDQIEAVLAE